MSALDDYKMFLNVLAQDEDGIAGDIINKWAKVKAITHQIEQGKMMPPPIPPEISPTQNTPMPTESNISPETTNTSPI